MDTNDKLVSIKLELPARLVERIKIVSQRKEISSDELMKVWLEDKVKEEFASN